MPSCIAQTAGKEGELTRRLNSIDMSRREFEKEGYGFHLGDYAIVKPGESCSHLDDVHLGILHRDGVEIIYLKREHEQIEEAIDLRQYLKKQGVDVSETGKRNAKKELEVSRSRTSKLLALL